MNEKGENRSVEPEDAVSNSEKNERKLKIPGAFFKAALTCLILIGCVVVYFGVGHPSNIERFNSCPAEREGMTGCTFDGIDLMVATCRNGKWEKSTGVVCEDRGCYHYGDHAKCGSLRAEICKGVVGTKNYKCSRKPSYSYLGKEVYDME